MSDKHKQILEWQLNLCETGNAGYHKGAITDLRVNVNAERLTDNELKLMIIKLNKELK